MRKPTIAARRREIVLSKAKYLLDFLPYNTPEFPGFSGFVQMSFKTRKSAMAYIQWLLDGGLVEDATLYTLPKRNAVYVIERGEVVE